MSLTMDTLFTKLEEASQAGDVNSLKELLKKDKHLLDKVIGVTLVEVRDNPLHIAAMLGHADFVREVIHHKPELAKGLNGQGLSPLHLAAAHGHVTVVKELLKADLDLCLTREKQEGLLPLHIAAKNGGTVIIKELVEACEEAVHVLTNGGETILHLAVKYNSLDTVEFLIDRVQDLNAKDHRGNTIFHHAVASKQLSVIKFLLSKEAIDVNTRNLKFLTPLDALLESPLQSGDLVLGEMIRAAGGKTAAEVLSESEPVVRDSNSSDSSNPRVRQPSTTNDIEEAILELPKVKKKTMYDPQILLLVATLVATVTFTAAILNPPGAFNSADGHPVLRDSLKYFQIYNVVAFISSVSVMMLFLCVVPRKKKIVMKFLEMVIWVATFFMVLAFYEGMAVFYAKDSDGNPSDDQQVLLNLIRACVILFTLGISWVIFRFLIFLLKKSGLWEPGRRCFGSLKRRLFFLKWQQLSKGSNCWKWFKRVICIVLILVVLVFYCYLLLVVIVELSILKH